MTEKKRLPPWEQARLVFRMQEERRKRKLLEGDMKQRQARARRPGPNTLVELEDNRKRLAEIKKRMEDEEGKD